MAKKTLLRGSAAPALTTNENIDTRTIPVIGLHAPAWADGLGQEDDPDVQRGLTDWYDVQLPGGRYRATLAGVREKMNFVFGSVEWVFTATHSISTGSLITETPATFEALPWKMIMLGYTGLNYGAAKYDLTTWVNNALGRAVEPAELEAVGLAAFVGEQFDILVNDRGRVESCRLIPDQDRIAGMVYDYERSEPEDNLMRTLRILSERQNPLAIASDQIQGIDDWWIAATARYRTGDYCRAWNEQEFVRKRRGRPMLVIGRDDWGKSLISAERATAAGRAARESDYTSVAFSDLIAVDGQEGSAPAPFLGE